MLSPTTNRTPGRLPLVVGTVLAGLLFATTEPVRGEAVKTDTSLSFIPADAAFYGSSLRNKGQGKLFLHGNAYKSLRNLPLVKMGHAKLMEKLKEEEQSPLKMYEKFIADPDNK